MRAQLPTDPSSAWRRRAAVAVVVGMLAFGRPTTSAWVTHMPPAVVRIQTSDPAAAEWRALFPTRPAPN